VRLALDHHYSPRIADRLRAQDHDVIAAVEVEAEAEDDASLLTRCASDRRALLTNNVADFAVIARGWLAEGRSHHGLIFTSDASRPRSRETIGSYVRALDRLMKDHPAINAMVERVHWL